MDLPYLLKKTVEALIYPSGLFFILFSLATIFSFSRYKRHRARALLVFSLFLFYISSTPFAYYLLARPLERSYSKSKLLDSNAPLEAIVVLPAYISNRKGLALQERFDRETWARFWAAVELKHRYPSAPLFIVGNGNPPGRGATYLALLARQLGVSPVKAIDGPKDTFSSVKALVPYLRGKSFIIVTSAYHLPRTLFLLKKQGLTATPYPALFLTRPRLNISLSDFWPRPYNFLYLNRVVNEYCGLLYYRLKFLF